MEKMEILRSRRDGGDDEKQEFWDEENSSERRIFEGPGMRNFAEILRGRKTSKIKKIYFAWIFGPKKRIFVKNSINFKSWFFWLKMPPNGD